MMHVRFATQAAPDAAVNEDHVIHAGPLVTVLDGASVPEGIDTGCVHGTPWYVTHLADRLAESAAARPDRDLPQILATAIRAVRDDHAGQCDLDQPGTPAAAVGMTRHRGEILDYLIMCDITLVADRGEDVQVLTDPRFAAAVADLRALTAANPLPFGTSEHAAHLRHITALRLQRINQPGGYWVAAADPTAAEHAITGALPLHGPDRVRRATLLTDGAADAVTRYHIHSWASLLDLLTTEGPHELIRQVRAAEHADTTGHAKPRYKRHDDATAAICFFDRPEPQ